MARSTLVMGRSLARFALRSSVTSVDQVVASLSNVAISFGLARWGGASELGEFGLVFVLYVACLNLVRGGILEPYLTSSRGDEFTPAMSAAVYGSLPASLVLIACSGIVDSAAVAALGACLPLLLIQDSLRFLYFRRQQPVKALLLDSIWLTASLVVGFTVLRDFPTPAVALLGWALGAVAGVVCAVWPLGVVPWLCSPFAALKWWRSSAQDLGRGLLADVALNTVGNQASIFLVAIIASAQTIGELRGGQILLTPAQLVVSSITIAVIPTLVTKPDLLTRKNAHLGSLALGAVAAIVLTPLALFAEPIARFAYAGNVDIGRGVLAPLVVVAIINAASASYVAFLKSVRSGTALMRARAVNVIVGVPAIILCAYLGTTWVAWAWALQAATYAATVGLSTRHRLDRTSIGVTAERSEPTL